MEKQEMNNQEILDKSQECKLTVEDKLQLNRAEELLRQSKWIAENPRHGWAVDDEQNTKNQTKRGKGKSITIKLLILPVLLGLNMAVAIYGNGWALLACLACSLVISFECIKLEAWLYE